LLALISEFAVLCTAVADRWHFLNFFPLPQ
jgi:hypothetical protein